MDAYLVREQAMLTIAWLLISLILAVLIHMRMDDDRGE